MKRDFALPTIALTCAEATARRSVVTLPPYSANRAMSSSSSRLAVVGLVAAAASLAVAQEAPVFEVRQALQYCCTELCMALR